MGEYFEKSYSVGDSVYIDNHSLNLKENAVILNGIYKINIVSYANVDSHHIIYVTLNDENHTRFYNDKHFTTLGEIRTRKINKIKQKIKDEV